MDTMNKNTVQEPESEEQEDLSQINMQKLQERIIRIRKHEVEIDGSKKVIVMIRDLSDSINFEKIMLN